MSAPTNLPAVKDIQAELMSDRMADQLRMALPSHIDVEKFQRTAITAINKSPDLQSAERRSLFIACVEAAKWAD